MSASKYSSVIPASTLDLRDIFDGISDALVVVDRSGAITYANPVAADLMAPLQAGGELIGKNLWELFPDGGEIGDFCRRVMEKGEGGTFEGFHEPLQIWLEIRACPAAEGLSLVVRNATEPRRWKADVVELTRKLQSQAELFDTTLSHIEDLAFTFDSAGRVIYANRALLKTWGRSLAEAVGRNLKELGYPEDLAETLNAQFVQVLDKGETVYGETLFTNAAGVEEEHDYTLNPVFDEKGCAVAIAGTSRIVTGRRKTERALRHLAAIVEFSDDAIVSKNLDGIVQTWNKGAERLFGYRPEEIIGRSITLLIPEDRADEEPEIIRRIRSGQSIDHYETVRRRKDGSDVVVSLSVSPIKDAAGRVVAVSKIARDITERKKTEAALKEAKEAAESANRAKDRFLAILSHELRTPLTPVLMMAGSLESDPALPEELRADMAMIRRNVELETKLIDDLLDLSRITSGKLNLHPQPVDLNAAVQDVCATCDPQIREKSVRLNIELDEGAGFVHADAARLQQVLWNILKNAIKFTPFEGNVSVRTRKREDGMVEASVQDDGIGIAPEVLPRIFDAFEQGNADIGRQFGGLGLGLAISKALVELHNGRIWAESEGPGRGSRFTVELPVTSAVEPVGSPHPGLKSAGGSRRILVVEDHPDTGQMLAKLLSAGGDFAIVATSVAEALGHARKESFDIVISDIGLPDASGYDFMRELRALQPIKGIAMSGYGMEEDVRRSMEAGFSEHLVKPINISLLREAIDRLSR